MNIIDQFYEQKDRWILWAPVFIAFGTAVYFSLTFEPNLWLGISTLAIITLKVISDYVKNRNFLIWIPVLLIALGFTASQFRTLSISETMLRKKTYPLEVTAKVMEVEALPRGEHRVLLNDISYQSKYGDMPQDPMPSSIRIKLKKGKHTVPFAGDKIKLKAILLPLSQPVIPRAFDFQRYAYFKGFYATGFAVSDAEIIEQRKEGFLFPSLRRYLRDNITENIKGGDEAAITIALLDGEDRDISPETQEIVRKAGIAHLMAISGLQVALVTGLFFLLLRYAMASVPNLALHYPIKKIAAFIAMCGAIFYMLLIGDSVSAERSVIMTCVVMLAIIFDRDPFTLRLVAFAAAVMLLFQPEILFGASFQLSFAAVIALVAFYESTSDWWSKLYYDRKWYTPIYINLIAVLFTTIVATISVAPFSLFHFLRTPLFPGLMANLVAVPVSSFITIPFAIVGSFLMPLGLEYYPLQVSAWSVDIILKTAREAASWPYGMFYMNAWSLELLGVIALGGLWLCIWQKKMRWFGIIPIVIAALIIPFTSRVDILIADRGKIFAVRDDAGKLFFSEERKEKFIREAWIDMEAGENIGFWQDEDFPVKCDDFLCSYKFKDKSVSFVKDYSKIKDACENNDIVIGTVYIDKKICSKPVVVIDKNDLKYRGAHAVYINDATVTVKNNYAERGRRPWTVY